MAEVFFGVFPSKFHIVFPNLSPCKCHTNIMALPPLYNVVTSNGNRVYPGHGKIVKSVSVECMTCGAKELFDVEDMELYDDDMNFSS